MELRYINKFYLQKPVALKTILKINTFYYPIINYMTYLFNSITIWNHSKSFSIYNVFFEALIVFLLNIDHLRTTLTDYRYTNFLLLRFEKLFFFFFLYQANIDRIWSCTGWLCISFWYSLSNDFSFKEVKGTQSSSLNRIY